MLAIFILILALIWCLNAAININNNVLCYLSLLMAALFGGCGLFLILETTTKVC